MSIRDLALQRLLARQSNRQLLKELGDQDLARQQMKTAGDVAAWQALLNGAGMAVDAYSKFNSPEAQAARMKSVLDENDQLLFGPPEKKDEKKIARKPWKTGPAPEAPEVVPPPEAAPANRAIKTASADVKEKPEILGAAPEQPEHSKLRPKKLPVKLLERTVTEYDDNGQPIPAGFGVGGGPSGPLPAGEPDDGRGDETRSPKEQLFQNNAPEWRDGLKRLKDQSSGLPFLDGQDPAGTRPLQLIGSKPKRLIYENEGQYSERQRANGVNPTKLQELIRRYYTEGLKKHPGQPVEAWDATTATPGPKINDAGFAIPGFPGVGKFLTDLLPASTGHIPEVKPVKIPAAKPVKPAKAEPRGGDAQGDYMDAEDLADEIIAKNPALKSQRTKLVREIEARRRAHEQRVIKERKLDTELSIKSEPYERKLLAETIRNNYDELMAQEGPEQALAIVKSKMKGSSLVFGDEAVMDLLDRMHEAHEKAGPALRLDDPEDAETTENRGKRAAMRELNQFASGRYADRKSLSDAESKRLAIMGNAYDAQQEVLDVISKNKRKASQYANAMTAIRRAMETAKLTDTVDTSRTGGKVTVDQREDNWNRATSKEDLEQQKRNQELSGSGGLALPTGVLSGTAGYKNGDEQVDASKTGLQNDKGGKETKSTTVSVIDAQGHSVAVDKDLYVSQVNAILGDPSIDADVKQALRRSLDVSFQLGQSKQDGIMTDKDAAFFNMIHLGYGSPEEAVGAMIDLRNETGRMYLNDVNDRNEQYAVPDSLLERARRITETEDDATVVSLRKARKATKQSGSKSTADLPAMLRSVLMDQASPEAAQAILRDVEGLDGMAEQSNQNVGAWIRPDGRMLFIDPTTETEHYLLDVQGYRPATAKEIAAEQNRLKKRKR